jgi:hypothetical protein
VRNRDRLGLTPELSTRWATGNDNFVYLSLGDFKSSFTCCKILQHGTFPLYFPSKRKVCCRFLLPLKIHHLGWVLNTQPLGPVASTLTTPPPRRQAGELKPGSGNKPTFVISNSKDIIALTLRTNHIHSLLRDGHVSDEPSLSAHRYTPFQIKKVHVGKITFPHPKRTDWES